MVNVYFDADYVKCKCGNDVEFHHIFSDCNHKKQGEIHSSFPFWTCVATGKPIDICSSEVLLKVLQMQIKSLCERKNDIVPKIMQRLEFAKKGNLKIDMSHDNRNEYMSIDHIKFSHKLYCIACEQERLEQELNIDMTCLKCENDHDLCDSCNEVKSNDELNSDNECEDCITNRIENIMENRNDRD